VKPQEEEEEEKKKKKNGMCHICPNMTCPQMDLNRM
jgi:hypothetical protein